MRPGFTANGPEHLLIKDIELRDGSAWPVTYLVFFMEHCGLPLLEKVATVHCVSFRHNCSHCCKLLMTTESSGG